MFDPNERLAFTRLFLSQRKTSRESLQLACLYTIQVLISAALLLVGYHLTHAKGVLWALVSAILVLQPGIEQSIAASAVRIAANTLGGISGFIVGELLGTHMAQVLLALTCTVFSAEFLRLDLGLRTACVATLIVMTTNDGQVKTSSIERFTAVLIGCLLAVLVQLLAEQLRKQFGWLNPPLSSLPATTKSPEHSDA